MKTLLKLSPVLNLILSWGLHAECAHKTEIEGTYALDIQLGERKFQDLVVIKEACRVEKKKATIQGSLTVPGQFTEKFTGAVTDSPDSFSTLISRNFDFEITAHEGASVFKVRYVFDDSSDITTNKRQCEGKAYFEGESEPVAFTCFKFQKDPRYQP